MQPVSLARHLHAGMGQPPLLQTPTQSTLGISRFAPFVGMGAAYGTAKSGVGVASMGVMRPELAMKSIIPVVMAGVLGIYGLIIAVIISTGSTRTARLSLGPPQQASQCRRIHALTHPRLVCLLPCRAALASAVPAWFPDDR